MSEPRRRRLLPDSIFKRAWRACVYMFFDVLHNVNLVDDAIRDRPGFWTRAWITLVITGHRLAAGAAVLISAILWIPRTGILLLGRGVWRVISRPWSVVRRVSIGALDGCHALLDNLGLLHDGIEGKRGLGRHIYLALCSGAQRMKVAWRFARSIGFFLLSETLYHLGLISDGVDVHRVWTRAMTWRVLPALVFVLAAIGLAARVATTDPQALAMQYAEAGGAAFKHKDYQAASVYLQRLAEMKVTDGSVFYHLALAADALGEHQRCQALMAMIAPPNRRGYWPAHMWQAKRLLERPSFTSGDLIVAWAHLQRTIAQRPNDQEAHFLLATTLWTLQDHPNVESNLEKAAESRPELWLFLAGQRRDQGKSAEAAEFARRAATALAEQIKSDPTSTTTRLLLAMADAFLNDYASAERVVQDGLRQQDGPFWRSVLAQLYLSWSQASGAQAPRDAVERCARLRQAVEADAWNPVVLRHLLELTRQTGPEADWATTTLAAMNWQTAPAAAHVAIALDDWAHDRQQSAREHLEAAYRLDPKMIEAANNLAWVLAEAEPRDLPRALDLVNGALSQSPGHPSLLDTRSQILTKMERWTEALADLELLAKHRAGDKNVHRALAACYAGLGMDDLAKYQQRLSETTPTEAKQTP